MQRRYSASQMDKFTETSTDTKECKGHMRINYSNLFQTEQELFNSNVFFFKMKAEQKSVVPIGTPKISSVSSQGERSLNPCS